MYTDDDHSYDCHVPSNRIRQALVELDKPWKSKQVLQYFHEKLKYSTRQLADLFGVARQTLQDVVREFDDFNFNPIHGHGTAYHAEQRTLDEYGSGGISEFM